jgi:hypothetical protein
MNIQTDQEPVRSPEQSRTKGEQHSAVVGNERLIALAGIVLLVLIIAEIVISINMRTLMSVHIFVGVLLTGPSSSKWAALAIVF